MRYDMTRVPRAFALILTLALLGDTAALAQRSTPNKNSDTLKEVFRDATAKASRSTLLLKTESEGADRQVAFGTIVSADGYILTKASEVMGESRVFAILPAGQINRRFEAKIVGFSAPHDLAMLKIDATGLTPITFSDTRPATSDLTEETNRGFGRGGGRGRNFRGGRGGGGGFAGGPGGQRGPRPLDLPVPTTAPAPPAGAIPVEVGEWVASVNAGAVLTAATPTPMEEPFAVGVISLTRRRVPPASALLGVRMAEEPADTQPATRPGRGQPTPPAEDLGGARIVQVYPDSAAEHARVKVDDVVTAINGAPVHNNTDLRANISRFHPGDVVTVTVHRGNETLSLKVTLGANTIDLSANPMESSTRGATSLRATDFPAVFQHDTVLRPQDCGGPLVDLDGHVIGINIARAGRTETYALPADIILPLIDPLKSGKLAPVNANNPAAATRPVEHNP
jgi:S1-C subfamily serine protease